MRLRNQYFMKALFKGIRYGAVRAEDIMLLTDVYFRGILWIELIPTPSNSVQSKTFGVNGNV